MSFCRHENTSITNATTERDRELQEQVSIMLLGVWSYLSRLSFRNHLSFECHSIARAISMYIPELKLINGVYLGLDWKEPESDKQVFSLKTCRHSWLLTPDGSIIDPYPVGFRTIDVPLVVNKGDREAYGGGYYQQDESVMSEISIKEVWRKSQVLFKFIQASEMEKSKKKK